jgi:hypothetical protein
VSQSTRNNEPAAVTLVSSTDAIIVWFLDELNTFPNSIASRPR